MCFLNTEKVHLGECCAISETSEMFTFLMALSMPNYDSTKGCLVYSALTYERIVNMFGIVDVMLAASLPSGNQKRF